MSLSGILENNPLCRMLGVRYPICQAGMYSVAYGKLAAAVSNAGGLGVIGSAFLDPEQLRREIRLVKNETDKPYGVDILFAEVQGRRRHDKRLRSGGRKAYRGDLRGRRIGHRLGPR